MGENTACPDEESCVAGSEQERIEARAADSRPGVAPPDRRSRLATVALILGMGALFVAMVAGILAMWLLVEPAVPS